MNVCIYACQIDIYIDVNIDIDTDIQIMIGKFTIYKDLKNKDLKNKNEKTNLSDE